MLFELEEGTSRKFYRIELDGTKVLLSWGRIGYDGQHQVLELGSEAAAQVEYEAQIARRRERGYRKVHREDAPHDLATIRRKKLEAAAPLTSNPRFRFVKKSKFVWLEANVVGLYVAEGLVDLEASIKPKLVAYEGLAMAVAERDRRMVKLLDEGFTLEQFGSHEPVDKRARYKMEPNDELEREIALDPYDDSCWAVLEDWILEHESDPRAAVIRFEKAGMIADAAQARGAMAKQLLGPRCESIGKAMHEPMWRAGFVVEGQFYYAKRSAHAVFSAFVAAKAVRLIRQLYVYGSIGDAAAVIALAKNLPALRRFGIAIGTGDVQIVDGETLPATLDAFSLTGYARLVWGAPLANLAELALSTEIAFAIPELLCHRFPRLHTLAIDGSMLWARADFADVVLLDPAIFDAAKLPALKSLTLENINATTASAIVRSLADNPLRSQLATLDLGATPVDVATLPEPLRTAFAHLDKLSYPS